MIENIKNILENNTDLNQEYEKVLNESNFSLKEIENESKVNWQKAELAYQNKNYEEAVIILHKALFFLQKAEDKTLETKTFIKLGLIFRKLLDYPYSLKFFKEALRLAREIGKKELEASCLGNIGLVYSEMGDLDYALDYHMQALKLDKQIENQYGIASQSANIGLIYKDLKAKEQALQYIQKAKEIFTMLNYPKQLALIEKEL